MILQTPYYQALLPEKPNSDIDTFIHGNIKFILNDDNQTQSIQFSPYIYPVSIYSPLYNLYSLSLNYHHTQNGSLYGLGQHHCGSNLTLAYHNFHLPFVFSSTEPTNGDIALPSYVHTSGFGFLWNEAGYGSFDVENDTNII